MLVPMRPACIFISLFVRTNAIIAISTLMYSKATRHRVSGCAGARNGTYSREAAADESGNDFCRRWNTDCTAS